MKLDAKQMMNRLRIYKWSDFSSVVMKPCHNTICVIWNQRKFQLQVLKLSTFWWKHLLRLQFFWEERITLEMCELSLTLSSRRLLLLYNQCSFSVSNWCSELNWRGKKNLFDLLNRCAATELVLSEVFQWGSTPVSFGLLEHHLWCFGTAEFKGS